MALQKRIPTKMESSETRKRSTVRVGRHMGGLGERVTPSWQFESLLWGIPSGFPLANHLALPGSESVFGLSQGPPMCA